MKKLVMLGAILFLPVSNVYANELTQNMMEVNQGIVSELNENKIVDITAQTIMRELSENEILDLEEIQNSHLVVNNQLISTSGVAWDHPNGFPHLRVYVENTQNQTLNVTFTSPNGQRFPFTVPAFSSRTYTGSFNPTGRARADFSTPNGNVTGRISVRASTLPL